MNRDRHRIRSLLTLAAMVTVTAVALAAIALAAPEPTPPGSSQLTSARELWRRVEARRSELGDLVRSGALAKTAGPTGDLRATTAALPASSPDLDADRRKKLENWVKFVEQLTERIDTAAKKNDTTDAEAAFGYLDRVLDSIAGLYPRGSL